MRTLLSSKTALWGAIIFYLVAGINHFVMPQFYLQLTPDFLPYPALINQIAGVAEIMLAIGLVFIATRKISAWLIVAMLLLFYLVHVGHLFKPPVALPYAVYIFRLFLQVFLIYWIVQVGKTKRVIV
ncbi:MAG: hypothetical protein ACFB0B_02575 [Thermonemataceae bacterium]